MSSYDELHKIWSGAKADYPHPMDTYFGEEILKMLNESPDEILEITHEENYSMTRKEARELSINVARNLMRLNVKPDDVVGFICRNSKYLSVLMYGCIIIGAPINPLDESVGDQYIKQIFSDTKPSIVFCDSELYEMTKANLEEIGSNAKVFTLLGKISGVPNVDELLKPTGEEDTFVPPKFDQPADRKLIAIICTSGTTGDPKGTIKTHATFLGFSKVTMMPMPHKTLNFSPISWMYGFLASIMVAVRSTECKVQTSEFFSPELLVKLVEKYQVTILFLPAEHLYQFLDSPLSDTVDFTSVKMVTSGGAVISNRLRNKFRQKFPTTSFVSGYSMTEASVSLCPPGKVYKNEASVGNLMFNVLVKIVDSDGNKLGIGGQGEILTKSLLPFMGYYNNPDATHNALDSEGFFKTGDVGYFEDDNSLVFVDRKKEILEFKGYPVNPKEIEDYVASLEGVAQVSVLGISDRELTYLATAAIVKKKNFDLTEQMVIDHVANHFPFHKHLHGGVVFMDSLPMTASGKVMKRLIRDKLITKE